MAFFVFSVCGVRGDVWPYLEIGAQLLARGHRVLVATSRGHEAATRSRGLEWTLGAPDAVTDPNFSSPHLGTETVLRGFVKAAPESVRQLRQAVAGADVLVSHTFSLAAPLVSQLEKSRGLKWVSGTVSPFALFENDVALPHVPALSGVGFLNRRALKKWHSRHAQITQPLRELRRDLGLAPSQNAWWQDAQSPFLQLCLWSEKWAFSSARGPRVHCGFAPAQSRASLSDEVEKFLESGAAPVVFVSASGLGGAQNEEFAAQSVAAAAQIGARALLIGGRAFAVTNEVLGVPFSPLTPVFERAGAVVHRGGIGVAALALRCGVPTVAAPWAHDSWDNSLRLKRLGLAQIAAPYVADELARALEFCYSKFEFRANCAYHGPKLAENQGEIEAANVLEAASAS